MCPLHGTERRRFLLTDSKNQAGREIVSIEMEWSVVCFCTYKEQKVDNEENEFDEVHTTPHLLYN